jgi:DNA-binding response OmpR family regulator
LVVESKASVYRWVADILLAAGLGVRHAPDIATAIFALATCGPSEAVVCGSGPGNEGGSALLRWMREEGINAPILFINGPAAVKKPNDRCAMLKTPFISTQLLEKMERILPNLSATWEPELSGGGNNP